MISIIVPAHTDDVGTARTLINLVHQRGEPVPREVIVVPDGPLPQIKKVVAYAQEAANKEKQPVKFRYLPTDKQRGEGNTGRALGIKEAKGDWIMFVDSGTSVLCHALTFIDLAIQTKPEAQLIMWDIIQMVDPAPFTHFCLTTTEHFNDDRIGYKIPGVGAAIRTEWARKVEWPNISVSDWAYWSEIWKLLPKPVDPGLIHTPIVIAYGATDYKRYRKPMSQEDWIAAGFDKPFSEVANAKPVSGPDGSGE